MFAILVRFELKDQAAANGFDALVEETVSAIQTSEPETLVYAVHRGEDAPLSASSTRCTRAGTRMVSTSRLNTPSVFTTK
jgi:queuine/archaeosine tRNA-ribosyltransferase